MVLHLHPLRIRLAEWRALKANGRTFTDSERPLPRRYKRGNRLRLAREVGGTPKLRDRDALNYTIAYGFPLDLTELMARERGLTVDVAGFERLMEQQRERARKAQKKEEISCRTRQS